MRNFLNKKVKPSEITARPGKSREELGDLKGLSQSIYSQGLLNPITVGPNLELIAGQRRLFAIRDYLKWNEVEVRIPLDEAGNPTILSEDEMMEIEIEENAQRKALTPKEDVMATRRLHEFKQKKYGQSKTGVGRGWAIKDTAAFLNKAVGTVCQDLQLADGMEKHPTLETFKNKTDAFKQMKKMEEAALTNEIVEVAARVGYKPEFIKLGENLPLLKEMKSESVHCLYTDPPYAVDFKDSDGMDVYAVEDVPHTIFENLSLVLRECYRILVPDSHAYVWFAMSHYDAVKKMLEDVGFKVNPNPLIWAKKGATAHPSKFTFSSNYEPCFHCLKGKREILRQNQSSVFMIDRVPDSQKIHPTEKPIRLIMPMLEMSTSEGETVLDPYMGSGSTIRAALQLRRQAIGMEMKKEFYDAAVARILTESTRPKSETTEGGDGGEEEDV